MNRQLSLCSALDPLVSMVTRNSNRSFDITRRFFTFDLSEFEIAYQILMEFLRSGNSGPKIVEAFGLVILRMPFLPNEVPADKREEVLLAGQAGLAMGARHLDEARKAFDTLVTSYPNDPNVHYSFGVFQLSQDADLALKELQRALELDPKHQPAMVQMAFEYLKRGQYYGCTSLGGTGCAAGTEDVSSTKCVGSSAA